MSYFSVTRLPGRIGSTFGALFNSTCPIFTFLRRLSPVTGAAVLLVGVAIPGFFYFKKSKNNNKSKNRPLYGSSLDGKVAVDPDAEFAEELQLQEALVASLYTGTSSKYASPSGGVDQLKSFCEICMDDKESWDMFKNDSCSHSFCFECTSKHITARIAQNMKVIGCPGVSCNAALDVNVCRFLIPKEALIRWDESVCQSMILDSQKLYCPFRDCSVMLVNDSGAIIQNIRCPSCKRSFCAACRVPWHSEFTCNEFQKLNAKKAGKEEGILKMLAKKKNWQKCPNCKIFVEKTEGCIHMTCRCSYEFCYKCGSKWTSTHYCRKK